MFTKQVVWLPSLVSCITAVGVTPCALDFDAKAVVSIYDASDIRTLDKRYHAYRYPDRISAVVYAVKLERLAPTDASGALLAAMPRNPIEFWSIYHFTEHPLIANRPDLARVFDEYLSSVARVVSRRATSTNEMRRYLLLSVFADGDAAELLAELNVQVAHANPNTFRRAVALLDPDERRRICGTDRPCTVPVEP